MTLLQDAATEAFLAAAADDLQRQVGSAASVADLVAEGDPARHVRLTATIRFASQTLDLEGTGENLVAAYGDLHRGLAGLALAVAFREYVTR